MAAGLKDPQIFRVFFSSPFKGMEEEREVLTRKYIPQIQHRCAEMGLQFVAVDMRWGISAESAQQAQTINICFREIDRSDMLLCFFGQRYGWQGHADSLLQENINAALGKYPWLEHARDCSVTELELRHGFLNNPGDMPTVVSFRDKKYDDIMKDLHKEKAQNYVSESDDSRAKMNELKRRVTAVEDEALAVHMDYPNPLEGARVMYEAVIKYLNETVLKQTEELSKREKAIAPHKAFAVSRTSLFVDDQASYDFLNNALKNTGANSDDSEDDGKNSHVLITGPAGCGKSSLLCNWLQSRVSQQQDAVVISFYVGCAPNTGDPEELLSFVYDELDHHLSTYAKTDDGGAETSNSGGDLIHKETSVDQNKLTLDDSDDQKKYNADETKSVVSDANEVSGTETKNGASVTSESCLTNPSDSVPMMFNIELIGQQAVNPDTISFKKTDIQTNSQDEKPKQHKMRLLGQQAVNPDSISFKKTDFPTNSQDPRQLDSELIIAQQEVNPDTISDNKTDSQAVDEKSTSEDKDSEKTKTKSESRPKGKELQHQVVKKLETLVAKGHKVVLVFDAINRLLTTTKIHKTLHWLPEKLARGVLCVITTEDTDQTSIDVLEKQRGFQVLKIGPLKEEPQREICVQTLKHSGKELSQAQLDRIVKCKETENPLFLKIVLAELSIFGYFRKLDEKIDSLIKASSIKELLHNCLQRLESDYNEASFEGNLVGEIMKAIYVSHQGLTENEICSMFKIPSNVWSPLYFAIEFFTMSHVGKLVFSFGEIKEAVKEKYFSNPNEEINTRAKLISYFDGIRKTLQPWMISKRLLEQHVEHAVVELVWLQRKQEDKEAVADTLTDLAVFRIMNDEHDLELLELWQWTGLKWSQVCCRLLNALDVAIADCYIATEEGTVDMEKSPGVRMRVAVAHMRSFFELANYLNGQEKVLEREIRILENAEDKMSEDKRKEYLRDAYYYLACTYASQDRYKEARALHESNMANLEKALEEQDDLELKKQIAFTHNGLGILCMHTGDFDEGIEHLVKSAKFHHGNNDKKNEAAGYTNLGLIYMYKQDFAKALEYDNKALEAYEEGLFGQLSMDLGNLYTNIGLVYRRMKNLVKAEEAYLKSLQIKANAVGSDHVVIATAYMNLGTLEMHRQNYAKAEEWTRKAIAVYEANEFAVTKKEYRRCRENLFANMLKQNKHEEILPFFIEIFDILKENGWLDECLGSMHRKMVQYIIDNKRDLLKKAEEICMGLIDSAKDHPQNYGYLCAIDEELPKSERTKRPYRYSLDACIDKFPTHSMIDTIIELKMELYLLPASDEEGTRTLFKKVAAVCTDSNFESIISKVTNVAQEAEKQEFWFQCLKSLLEEDPSDKKVFQLFVRLCILTDRPQAAVPYIDNILNSIQNGSEEFKPDGIKPVRTTVDVAKVLIARGSTAQANQLLKFVEEKSMDRKLKDEAITLLKNLSADEGGDATALVTSTD